VRQPHSEVTLGTNKSRSKARAATFGNVWAPERRTRPPCSDRAEGQLLLLASMTLNERLQDGTSLNDKPHGAGFRALCLRKGLATSALWC
jgi:hypothetical protein